jgi:hypothetical protein
MSRKYNIRWSSADDAELKRVVKNFNAKLTRLEKKDPQNKSALPERISAAHLRDMIGTRQDLNRELNALRRFSERGAEELVTIPDNDNNIKITKWQKKEMTRREVIVNQKRRAQLERLANTELTDRGEPLGYTKGELDKINLGVFEHPEAYEKGQIGMKKISEIELYPVRAFTASQTRGDINKRAKQLQKESMSTYWDSRNELLRTNYVQSIERNFKDVYIEDIVSTIMAMDFDEFRKIFEAENQRAFAFNYPQTKEEQEQYASALRAIWKPNI